MASSTKNVKIGVCRTFFGGLDLGYTQGGVEVAVKTDTHKVNVDQFGKTAINEYLMGRDVSAKVPLAESTLINLVATMPGASLVTTGGAAATGTLTVTTNPTAGQTLLVNGVTLTFKATGTAVKALNEIDLGANANATATNIADFVKTSYSLSGILDASATTATVTLTARYKGLDGNSITTVQGTATGITVAQATLAGGTEPTTAYIQAGTGIGTDLLSVAKELRFRPVSKYNSAGVFSGDFSEDFVIPLAATPGALTFAYKLEDERVYNIEFMGYPDSQSGALFYVGR